MIQMPCHMHAMGVPYVCHVYSEVFNMCLCAFHVDAMCAHGHVHAMGSHVYSM